MPKQTLQEKRLEMLRRQLSGKPRSVEEPKKTEKSSQGFSFSSQPSKTSLTQSTTSDTAYLRGDLLKTFILAFLAIAAELSLYFLSRSHTIDLNFLHF